MLREAAIHASLLFTCSCILPFLDYYSYVLQVELYHMNRYCFKIANQLLVITAAVAVF